MVDLDDAVAFLLVTIRSKRAPFTSLCLVVSKGLGDACFFLFFGAYPLHGLLGRT